MYEKDIFPEIFRDIAHACYAEQMEAFTKLFEDQAFYDETMHEIARETYRSLRNE